LNFIGNSVELNLTKQMKMHLKQYKIVVSDLKY